VNAAVKPDLPALEKVFEVVENSRDWEMEIRTNTAAGKHGAVAASRHLLGRAMFMRSGAFILQSDVGSSLPHLERAIAVDYDGRYRAQRGSLYACTGNFEGAQADFSKAVQAATGDERDLDYHLYTLSTYSHHLDGDDVAGRAYYDRAVIAEARKAYLYGRQADGTRVGAPADSIEDEVRRVAQAIYAPPEEQLRGLSLQVSSTAAAPPLTAPP